MSSFAALMALSATQTRQSEAMVQTQLAERQRKEAQRRKEMEERDRKEREKEAKIRLRKFEEEKREEERQRRLEQEREAKARELQRREEEERDKLRYGPKKAAAHKTDSKGYPVSSVGARKGGASSVSDDESSAANALTREEKRKRRMEAEMRHGVNSTKRSSHGNGYSKMGKRLPGGAMDITTTSLSLTDPTGAMSVRQRLAAEPAMLIKLNVNKRDTRTIDEILQDRAKAKAAVVLQGDQAKEFNDWFGKGKAAAKKATSQTDSTSTSRANTPATSSQPTPKYQSGSASPAARASSAPKVKRPPSPTLSRPSFQRPMPPKATPVKASSSMNAKTAMTASKPLASSSKLGASASKPIIKKRPRSPSPSYPPSPPPKKRALSSGPRQNEISQEIWKLFGKDRSQYVAADVMSDDEDMEAGARDLEYEELRSTRIARREEELAAEEERRHEEEKRKKRKEKEARDRRGQ